MPPLPRPAGWWCLPRADCSEAGSSSSQEDAFQRRRRRAEVREQPGPVRLEGADGNLVWREPLQSMSADQSRGNIGLLQVLPKPLGRVGVGRIANDGDGIGNE